MDRNLRIRMLLEAGDRVTKPLRDIAGGSTRAAQALKATRDRLKEIDRAQADIAGFRELKKGLRSAEAELGQAQTKVAQLARQMAQTEAPTKKLVAEFARAKREAAGLKATHAEQSAELQRLRDRMSAAGIATSSLAAHERRLRSDAATANAELQEQERRLQQVADRSRRLSAARDQFGKMQGTATGLATGGAAAIGTGMVAAAPIAGSVGAAMQYQSVMTDIAQKANLSRVEAAKMGLGLIAAAKAANQLPEALQQGVDTLSGFGLDPRQAVQMMTPIGRAATAYKAEIADLSSAAFAANDNLKVPVQQTAKVIDIMAAAGKAGAFEIKDMAGQFPALTAAYQALGQKGTRAVADLAAGAQIARKGAGDSASAGNNLLNLLNKISTKDANDNFKKFGVDLPAALKKAASEGKGPIEAIAELTQKALKGDMSKLSYLFGDAQVQAALRPLIANIGEFRKIRDDAFAASGTTDRDFAERMQDGAEKAKRWQIAQQALGLTMGSLLLPAASALAERAAALADRFGKWADRNPKLARGLAIAAAAIAALMIVGGALAIVAAGLIAPFAALSAAATALGMGMLPVLGIAAGVVLGIAALAAAAYLIYANWGAVTGFFGGIWNRITSIFSGGIGGIFKGLAYLAGYALGLLFRMGAAAFNWLTGVFPGLLGRGIVVAFTALKAAVVFAFTELPGMFFRLGAFVVKGLIRGLLSAPGAIASAVKSLWGSLASGFKKAAGINSPSRVFIGFGGYLSEGLAIGIHRGAEEPVRRVQRLSRDVAAAMAIGASTAAAAYAAPAAGPASRGAASAGVPAPITINVYGAPGQSPADIAAAVRAELDKVKREQAAAARSSFADSSDYSWS